MDYLQYEKEKKEWLNKIYSFKPYYKWITFNINVNTDPADISKLQF